MMNERILLVGDARICPQVAYVMDWQNYAMVERLTVDDLSKYPDYQIVICDFKRYGKNKYLSPALRKNNRSLWLDDICRELDREERQEAAVYSLKFNSLPLWRRIVNRIKTGTLGTAIARHLKRPWALRSFRIINQLPIAALKLSELFIKVLYSPVAASIDCDLLYKWASIDSDLNLTACATGWVPPFGNLRTADLESLYNGYRARIIKLSALNQSYCLCNMAACGRGKYLNQGRIDRKNIPFNTKPHPQELILSFDRSCNLRCESCRQDFILHNSTEQKELTMVVKKLLASGWIDYVPNIAVAGDGEVFYSEIYQHLLKQDFHRRQITILTNGTLLNSEQWEILAAKYNEINVDVSIDAATAATYQKIRGANFNKLLENLTMLKQLRLTGAIHLFALHFVVQSSNYREMKDFVKLGKELAADKIFFMKLLNHGTYSARTWRKKCLIIKQKYLARELYTVLQDPIFNDPVVDLTAFQPYLVNSAKHYDKTRK